MSASKPCASNDSQRGPCGKLIFVLPRDKTVLTLKWRFAAQASSNLEVLPVAVLYASNWAFPARLPHVALMYVIIPSDPIPNFACAPCVVIVWVIMEWLRCTLNGITSSLSSMVKICESKSSVLVLYSFTLLRPILRMIKDSTASAVSPSYRSEWSAKNNVCMNWRKILLFRKMFSLSAGEWLVDRPLERLQGKPFSWRQGP